MNILKVYIRNADYADRAQIYADHIFSTKNLRKSASSAFSNSFFTHCSYHARCHTRIRNHTHSRIHTRTHYVCSGHHSG